MRTFLLGAALALAGLPVQAADKSGDFMSWGVGREPCAAFIDNSDEADNSPAAMSDMYAALQWAEGYVTAHNRESPGIYDVLKSTDSRGMRLWLYDRCRADPDRAFGRAVQDMIDDLSETEKRK